MREREVFLDDARPSVLPGDFGAVSRASVMKPLSFMIRSNCPTASTNFVTVSLSVISCGTILPRQSVGEVALSAASFFGRLGQEQVAVVVQERAFVEMPLKTPGQEAEPSFSVSGW